jgi:hypothetical protein
MKYIQPLNEEEGASYVNADPANGIEGSIIPAGALENPQREIVNVITDAGLNPSENDNTQLKQAISAKISSALSNYANTDVNNLTSTGKNTIADLAMPGSYYEDLTIDVTGTSYTAPNNGWFIIGIDNSTDGIQAFNNNTNLGYTATPLATSLPSATFGSILSVPCKKNDEITVRYSGSSTNVTLFRFIYAQGAI